MSLHGAEFRGLTVVVAAAERPLPPLLQPAAAKASTATASAAAATGNRHIPAEPSGRPPRATYARRKVTGRAEVSDKGEAQLKRAREAHARSQAAHELARNTHRRAAELHYQAAHFQEEHAAAERELGHPEKAEKMEAAARRARDRARAEHLRAELQ